MLLVHDLLDMASLEWGRRWLRTFRGFPLAMLVLVGGWASVLRSAGEEPEL